MLIDRINASFRKAYRWKLTYTQYNFNDLFDVDSKLFACSKSELHCLQTASYVITALIVLVAR